MQRASNQPLALVVGLCSHGLAMTRALRQCGAQVHAFEAKGNLPGVLTNSAKVHLIRNIKTDSLVEDLLAFREQIPREQPIVLFPTNDNNVTVIGKHIDILSPHFEISWHHCASVVLSLLMKSNIEQRCKETGLNYPQSYVMRSAEDINEVEARFEFPVIAKPVQPQSGFKALRCDTVDELKVLVETYHKDLPILIQHWITGTDKDIFFGALYLNHGDIEASFTGNKLESHPPAMGQTTVAVNSDNAEVLPLTEKFFAGLNMSGPVSLELKRDDKGRFWVIEPTIGRTDFWVGLCVAAGCNLLEMEYQHCAGLAIEPANSIIDTIWFDSERDVTAYPRHLSKTFPWSASPLAPTFSYLRAGDLWPSGRAAWQTFGKLSRSVIRRLGLSAGEHEPALGSVDVYDSLTALPPGFKKLLDSETECCIFSGTLWYQNFCKQVASRDGKVRFYCLSSHQNYPLAIFPMWSYQQKHFGIRFNYLTSLTNYYSPIFDIVCDNARIDTATVYNLFFRYLRKTVKKWDVIDIRPISAEAEQMIRDAAQRVNLVAHTYSVTKNWFERVENGYQTYLTKIPSRTKNTIKRKIKKLDKEGDWQIKIYTDLSDLKTGLRCYEEVYQQSWKPQEPYPHFVPGLAYLAAENGWLRLGVLSIGNEPVAAQLWLHGNDKAYIYKLAYKDSARNFSPGSVLTAHMMENAIDKEGIEFIDFLTGKDEFKRDWMSSSRELLGIQIDNKSNLKSIVFALKNSFSEWRQRFASKMHTIDSKAE